LTNGTEKNVDRTLLHCTVLRTCRGCGGGLCLIFKDRVTADGWEITGAVVATRAQTALSNIPVCFFFQTQVRVLSRNQSVKRNSC
jgi:hypothetical protein